MGKSKKAQIGKKIGLGAFETVIHVCVYILVIFVFIKVATLAYDFSYQVFGDPVMSKYDKETVSVEVPEGSTAKDVAKILKHAGLIKYETAFTLRIKLAKVAEGIAPGTYNLSPSMTQDQIMSEMTKVQTSQNAGENEAGNVKESESGSDSKSSDGQTGE